MAHLTLKLEDRADVQAALKRMRPRLYAQARSYWVQVGDHARLALTDAELDEQFWMIDSEGIPRLYADMGTIDSPADSLIQIAETAVQEGWQVERDDIAENFDQVLFKV